MTDCKNCLKLEKQKIELILDGTKVLEDLKTMTADRDHFFKLYTDLMEEKIHWELKKGTN